ncbi:hypothetical protein EJ07DRAFT_144205 [Lizonia empirigonia]|nr:hypothetical protein EJ07DRAFT_144205 [Lizonia empirigonia]
MYSSRSNTRGVPNNKGAKSSTMTKSDASRVQSSQARGEKDTSPGSFAARAQGAGDRNSNKTGSGGKEDHVDKGDALVLKSGS